MDNQTQPSRKRRFKQSLARLSEQAKNISARTLKLFFQHDGMASAGNIAFLAMLSLFPFVIFLVTISGFLGQSARDEEAILFALSVLPTEVANVIKGPIDGIVKSASGDLLTGSILVSLWTASGVVEAARNVLLKAFGRQYGRPMWIRRLQSLGVVAFGSIGIIVSMSILILGPAALKAGTSIFPAEVVEPFYLLWRYLSLFVSPLILLLLLYVSYVVLTPSRVQGAFRLPGAVFALVVFLASARGLSVYLSSVGSYDLTYGSLAGVVVTQLFCFVIAIGFTFGAQLNVAFTECWGKSANQLN